MIEVKVDHDAPALIADYHIVGCSHFVDHWNCMTVADPRGNYGNLNSRNLAPNVLQGLVPGA